MTDRSVEPVLPVPLTMSAAFDPALVQEGYGDLGTQALVKFYEK